MKYIYFNKLDYFSRSAKGKKKKNFCYLPLIKTLAVCSAHLEGDFEEMESRLVYLETLCCQCDEQTAKQHHSNKLEVYKKKKRYDMLVIVQILFYYLLCR